MDLLTDEEKDWLMEQVEKKMKTNEWQKGLDDLMWELTKETLSEYERKHNEKLGSDKSESAFGFIEEVVKGEIRNYIN